MTVIGDFQEDYDTLLEKFRSGISGRMDSKDLKNFLILYRPFRNSLFPFVKGISTQPYIIIKNAFQNTVLP